MMIYRMVQTVVAPTMPMGISLAGFFACSRTSPQSGSDTREISFHYEFCKQHMQVLNSVK